jgi:hypothetical protein
MMCEQTASFALMTHLCSVLSNISDSITPLSFWVTREGSRLSEQCDDGRRLRIMGFYPRRPKMFSIPSSQFLVKINAHIIDAFRRATACKIPFLIGVPLVTSILAYRLSSPCAWYRSKGIGNSDNDYLIRLDLAGSIVDSDPMDLPFEGPINDRVLLDLATSGSQVCTWAEAIVCMHHILRPERFATHLSPFGLRHYRPYFVAF